MSIKTRAVAILAGVLFCAGIVALDQHLCSRAHAPQVEEIHPPAAFLAAVKADR